MSGSIWNMLRAEYLVRHTVADYVNPVVRFCLEKLDQRRLKIAEHLRPLESSRMHDAGCEVLLDNKLRSKQRSSHSTIISAEYLQPSL